MTPAMSAALGIWLPPALSPSASEKEKKEARAKALIRRSLSEDDWPRKVAAFNIAMGTAISGAGLSPLPGHVLINEFRMLREELQETEEALDNNDLIEGLDGLLDLIYVALGTAIKLGFTPDQINAAMQEIHASNMSKVDKHGNPVYDANGKVTKSDQYKPVDLPAVLDL